MLGASSSVPRFLKASADGSVIAVHKPPGMPFHSMEGKAGLLATLRSNPSCLVPSISSSTFSGTNLPCRDSSSSDSRLHAVHRLDTGTSGIVLFATSSHAAGLIAKAFRERRVHKYYFALSTRKPKKKQGSIIGDMARGRCSTWKLLPRGGSHGPPKDPAVTRFWSTSLSEVQPGLRLYLLKPETGRTHQLRVAMKSLGAAISGDDLYGSSAYGNAAAATGRTNPATEAAGDELQPDRMYLHAAAIRVQLPDESWFQVVDLPCEGCLFQESRVQQLCQLLMPDSLAGEFGDWFDDQKLLASTTLA